MIAYEIRRALVTDAEAIARHRIKMFAEMGDIDPEAGPAVESAILARLKADLPNGVYRGWVAEAGGSVVAGAGVILHPYYPNAKNPLGRPAAHVINVYTEPAHRGRGLAGRLVSAILDWARTENLRVANLHASSAGRSIYARLGFTQTNEMRVHLE